MCVRKAAGDMWRWRLNCPQVPTVLIARTDADSASLLTSDIDESDRAFCTGERTPEGFFKIREGIEVPPCPSPPFPSLFLELRVLGF